MRSFAPAPALRSGFTHHGEEDGEVVEVGEDPADHRLQL